MLFIVSEKFVIIENFFKIQLSFLVQRKGTEKRWLLIRDVHVILVSLLADQLSTQFLIFWVGQKKIRDWTIYILSILLIFLSSQDIREQRVTNFQKILDKKFKRVDKKNVRSLRLDNFFGADPKNDKLTGQLVNQRD